MISPLARRLLLTGLPALLVAAVVVSTIWGEHGLLKRQELQSDLDRATARLAAVERSNQRLLREISLLERDPVILERVAADEIGWGHEGAVLYRFESEAHATP